MRRYAEVYRTEEGAWFGDKVHRDTLAVGPTQRWGLPTFSTNITAEESWYRDGGHLTLCSNQTDRWSVLAVLYTVWVIQNDSMGATRASGLSTATSNDRL